jgi:hypothetical protein
VDYKIYLIKHLEAFNQINMFNFNDIENFKGVPDELYIHIKRRFRTKKLKPTTLTTFIKFYTDLLTSILGDDFIITESTQKRENGVRKRSTNYEVNELKFNYFMELYEIYDHQFNEIDKVFINNKYCVIYFAKNIETNYFNNLNSAIEYMKGLEIVNNYKIELYDPDSTKIGSIKTHAEKKFLMQNTNQCTIPNFFQVEEK